MEVIQIPISFLHNHDIFGLLNYVFQNTIGLALIIPLGLGITAYVHSDGNEILPLIIESGYFVLLGTLGVDILNIATASPINITLTAINTIFVAMMTYNLIYPIVMPKEDY
ncbi:hypothetical protein J2127_001075 [Methanococcus voltae]|uniref:hypothetical protein n=1 Tax=Methanococcus voltae TaxID=2188 RepID=UPI001AE5287E|nr:hypothetical protein [Methanococcus voltae]MBP2143906.1 hypothetical protein [Methanococcus voltae]